MQSDAPAHNLPVQRDPLIGREHDVRTVRLLLAREDVGLVTLVGAGGTGKTRIALKLGADLLADFEDGVFFVPLASITDPLLVTSAIAHVVGIRDAGSRPLLETLKEYLRHRHCLLIIDNFEHLTTAAPILAELLSVGARLKLLVTSRALLHLHDEHVLQVSPLALPDSASMAARDVERLASCPSVALFMRRVAAADLSFQITTDDVLAAGEICIRLDGLPLAIELAAARVRLFPPRMMRERLERRLPLLTGGPRDVPARQRTLRDAIAWSYDLLSPEEQQLFRCLVVFPSGCTFASLRAVYGGGAADDEVGLSDALRSLMDKSLVERRANGDEDSRFVVLETIREFGLEQLDALGETDKLRQRHALVFLNFVEQASSRLTSPDRGAWVARLDAEHDNVRSALKWSHAAPDGGEMMLRLTGALGWFWYRRGHLGEGRRWVEAALSRSEQQSTLVRARALFSIGLISFFLGDYRPMSTYLVESVAILRKLDHAPALGYSLTVLGMAQYRAGDLDVARHLHAEARSLLREVGDTWGLAFASTNEGDVHAALGNYAAAEAAFDESADMARSLDDTWLHSHSHMIRALMEFRRGSLALLATWYARSLAELRQDGDPWFIARSLQGLASVLWRLGDPARAAELWGAAKSHLDAIGVPTHAALRAEYAGDERAARAALREPALARAWRAGKALSAREVIARSEAYAAAVAGGPRIVPPAAESDLPTDGAIGRSRGVTSSGVELLTPREREVAKLVARGYSNRQIAETLVIGVRTAEDHIAHISGKLRANSRSQIAAWAVQHGLLAEDV